MLRKSAMENRKILDYKSPSISQFVAEPSA